MPSDMVPMFYAARRVSNTSLPSGFVERDGAREMVNAGLATWTKGCKGIMLRKSEAAMTPTQRSCKMGPEVIWGCVIGEKRDEALRDAWEPVRKAA